MNWLSAPSDQAAPTTRDRRLQYGLVSLLLAHSLLAVLYSLVVPLWEAPDEPAHYAYVQYIANHLRLPAAGERVMGETDETKQPALYYLLVGLSTASVQPRAPLYLHLNRFLASGEINFAIHSADESNLFDGFALGVHLARFITILFSCITVWGTFELMQLIFPARVTLTLAATALAAFWPQFVFFSAVVNNIALSVGLASLIVVVALRLIGQPANALNLLWLLLLLIAGALTRANVLTLAPLALLSLAIGTWKLGLKYHVSRTRMSALAVLSAGVLALGAWLYIADLAQRQTLDLPLVQAIQALTQFVTNPFSPIFGWALMPAAITRGFKSSWALFGWETLPVDQNIYLLLLVVCLFGALGLLPDFARWTRMRRVNIGLLVFSLVGVVATTMYFALFLRNAGALSGRYLLIALSPICVLLVTGFAHGFPKRLQDGAAVMLASALAVWALVIPFQTILPAYAPPRILAESELAHVPNPVQARFGDEFELVGYRLAHDTVTRGEPLPLTLYWHVLKPITNDYAVEVRLTDATSTVVGSVEHYPANGNYATSLWKRGDIIPDEYLVPINADIGEPSGGKVVVSAFLSNGKTETPLKVMRADKPAIAVTLGQFRLLPSTMPAAKPAVSLRYQFGDQLALIGYDLSSADQKLWLTLYWQTLRQPDRDYTTFVHLTTDTNTMVAQYDNQPLAGRFPTSLWRPGDVIVDRIALTLAQPLDSERTHLWLGMYQLETLQRLAITDAQGQKLPDDQVLINLP